MPIGWHITVYRQAAARLKPATMLAETAGRVAVWQTGLGGLDWIEGIAGSNTCFFLGGNGYPYRFTAQSRAILPIIMAGPPQARDVWLTDPGDVVGPKWVGHTLIEQHVAKACLPNEWLVIQVWDES